ncbi:MAG: hypothetical protein KJ007_10240 [Burkholderiales bacterium]|nr:hypothetical protein [Burkholderiales bacterium]
MSEQKTMESWFFMRPGFNTFGLEPEKHRYVLLGEEDRRQRDSLLREIEGATFSNDGYKAVIFGDYGRGKTHLVHNLAFLAEQRGMKVMPIYIKSAAYTSKEPFQNIFKEFVLRIRAEDVKRVASEYRKYVEEGKASKLADILQFEEIAFVMEEGLTAVNLNTVRTCMKWLGGEDKVPMANIRESLKARLTDSREFGAVLRGLSHMFSTVDGKVLLYLVDEAERFQNIVNVDTQYQWLASLRELTEIPGVGFVFLIGAKTKNELPVLFVQDEIVRRIGSTNYTEIFNPGKEALKDFVLELLATCIRKGEPPVTQRDYLPEAAKDAAVPDALKEITGGDSAALETYPFEPDALDAFVDQLTTGTFGNKPSEVLIRVQKNARRAMLEGARTISLKLVEKSNTEGF